MRSFLLFLLLIIFSGLRVQSQSVKEVPVVSPKTIITPNIMTWLVYERDHVKLEEDFEARDANQKPITKRLFLQLLSKGGYLPLRLKSASGKYVYQLYKIADGKNESLKAVIQDYGNTYYKHFLMEGKPLPNFAFEDLNGNKYTNLNTKGKVLVLKCWFIRCLPCRQEMPRLNEILNYYKPRTDVLFVSLASDPKPALRTFLKKTKFDYAVVGNADAYMSEKLKVNMFPTHIIVNKQGLIVKVANDAEEMIKALRKM